jgi:hypothetical protein
LTSIRLTAQLYARSPEIDYSIKKKNRNKENMKRITLVSMILICCLAAGCSYLSSGPALSAEQAVATLTKFMAQESPGAKFDVTGGNTVTERMKDVDFTFTNFAYKDPAKGISKTIPSGTGTARFFRGEGKPWVMDTVYIKDGKDTYELRPNLPAN